MAEVDTRHSMIRKSDQNYSALISNPNTDNFVQDTQWFESLIRKKYPELISTDQQL